ncbi:hypothetical protein DL765_008254 [Monosporascus sp. GIB2]|nr:hypothetical protein DL765_008254 [Monosporascus sp. GIB2]
MKSFSVALALIAPAQAGLRFGCSSLTTQRIDPVVEPGNVPSAHVHHIIGGNAFNATMTGDVGARGTCTTCEMSEDFSNYWTAVLYFKHPVNGSYHRVPVVKNAALAPGTVGGMTIYYTQHDFYTDNLKNQPITAFPPAMSSWHLRCPPLPRVSNPFTPMYELVVTRPRCWDGKNLDSPDHQSHMFNTIKYDGFMNAPPCPASHPVRMPQLTYETVWDTTKFNSMWPAGAPNPFVWSFGGTRGYGTHADYMFGWEGDSLQRAMNKSECFYDGCGSIKKQPMSIANECTVEDFVGEETDGWLTSLPGQD